MWVPGDGLWDPGSCQVWVLGGHWGQLLWNFWKNGRGVVMEDKGLAVLFEADTDIEFRLRYFEGTSLCLEAN